MPVVESIERVLELARRCLSVLVESVSRARQGNALPFGTGPSNGWLAARAGRARAPQTRWVADQALSSRCSRWPKRATAPAANVARFRILLQSGCGP